MSDLTVTDVTLAYENTNIIEDINIELHDNELVCLLGASGGGKTTLFNVISGLKKPDQGKVMLNGRDITGRPGHISYMLQKDLLLPYRTIEDNVALPLLIKGENKKTARQKAGALFQEFGLEGTQEKYPKQLSGGMRQRAALLRTYMFSEDVALLDEPFSALDTLTKRSMDGYPPPAALFSSPSESGSQAAQKNPQAFPPSPPQAPCPPGTGPGNLPPPRWTWHFCCCPAGGGSLRLSCPLPSLH